MITPSAIDEIKKTLNNINISKKTNVQIHHKKH